MKKLSENFFRYILDQTQIAMLLVKTLAKMHYYVLNNWEKISIIWRIHIITLCGLLHKLSWLCHKMQIFPQIQSPPTTGTQHWMLDQNKLWKTKVQILGISSYFWWCPFDLHLVPPFASRSPCICPIQESVCCCLCHFGLGPLKLPVRIIINKW